MRTEDFSERLLSLALERGASQAEVYVKSSRLLSVEVKSGEVDALESASGRGFGLRVVREGRPGFYYSTDLGEPDAAVRLALETAGFSEPDEFIDFPQSPAVRPAGERPAGRPDVYDPHVAGMGEYDAVDKARMVERSALEEDHRIKKIRKALASFSSSETRVINSNGLSSSYSSTFCAAHITAVAEEGGESRMGWDFRGGRFLSDLEFGHVGRDAARRALMMLGSRRMSAEKASVILDGSVATEFLSVFAAMLSAESVQKGKSLLKGKLNRKVVSEAVDVLDDGLLPRGPGTRPFDDEGVPTRTKTLIEKGVLTGFMHNSRSAAKDGLSSTGNAVRGTFSAVPSIGPTNLFLSTSGKKMPLDEMIAMVGRGLYVVEAMGVHTANPVSGDFSIGVSGLWIEGGQRKYPVKETVISGNLLDFFNRVAAVGDDLRFYGRIGAPALLVTPVDISA